MKRRASGIVLLMLWGCSCVLYVYAGGFVPAFLIYSLGALLAGSVLVPFVCVKGVDVERSIERSICMSGDSVLVRVHVRFWSALPVPWLLVREGWTFQHVTPSEATYSRLFFPWGAREISFAYTVGSVPRGRHQVLPMELQSGDLFGFVSFRRIVKSDQQLLVYPKPALTRIGPAGRILPFDRLPSGRRAGVQSVFGSGIRSFSPGDPIRSIHWKSSAKRGELLTFEREAAVSRTITIVLDGSLRGASGREFEAAVEAAAGLWLQAKRDDNAAGFLLCGFGHEVTRLTAAGLRGTANNVFRSLAELTSVQGQQPGDGFRLAAAQTAPGSRLIVVTAGLDEPIVAALRSIDQRRRSISVIAMSSEEPTGEERLLKRLLEASGFEVLLAPVPQRREVKPYAYAHDAGA